MKELNEEQKEKRQFQVRLAITAAILSRPDILPGADLKELDNKIENLHKLGQRIFAIVSGED
jgi:hypothetical protein